MFGLRFQYWKWLTIYSKRSLLWEGDAKATGKTADMKTPFADVGVRRYAWVNGVKYMVDDKKLPFSNLWFNDTAVFSSNLVGKDTLIKDDDTKSWIVDRLGDYKKQFDSLPASTDVINAEFKETTSKAPNYGMISVERAKEVTTSGAKILGPSKDNISRYWAKLKKGFTNRNNYSKLRVPVVTARPRNVGKWLSINGATDTPM